VWKATLYHSGFARSRHLAEGDGDGVFARRVIATTRAVDGLKHVEEALADLVRTVETRPRSLERGR